MSLQREAGGVVSGRDTDAGIKRAGPGLAHLMILHVTLGKLIPTLL